MHRKKYPERVPFRLTRMLTYAMEVSNIEGSYRTTCEHVMRVLRQNKESVMAVLEAVSYRRLLTKKELSVPLIKPSPTGITTITDCIFPVYTRPTSNLAPQQSRLTT